MAVIQVAAVDLGASSGRVMVGRFSGEQLDMQESHRFSNGPVQLGQRLHWDFPRLLAEVKLGLSQAGRNGGLLSFGVDTWAVDFGLLDEAGELLGLPYHYRDQQTTGMMEVVARALDPAELYRRTGIQFLELNTIYQLAALRRRRPETLAAVRRLLLMPDLFRYFLTGEQATERTNASTTQLWNPLQDAWDPHVLGALGLSSQLLAPLLQAGQIAGRLTANIGDELRLGRLPMTAVGEHDTASAVVAVPADREPFAYISSGTWSLIGTERAMPLLTDGARIANFTNEAGVYGRTRLLKNVMGLWIVQECLRRWRLQGSAITFAEAVRLAASAPAKSSVIHPDDASFYAPADMPTAVRDYCKRTGQGTPVSEGEVLRVVFASLALRYRQTLEELEALTDTQYSRLHIVGGGSRNELLCQWTANATGRQVLAGPSECTAIGNALIQLIAAGAVADLQQARAVVRNSFALQTYEPSELHTWQDAYGRFCQLPR